MRLSLLSLGLLVLLAAAAVAQPGSGASFAEDVKRLSASPEGSRLLSRVEARFKAHPTDGADEVLQLLAQLRRSVQRAEQAGEKAWRIASKTCGDAVAESQGKLSSYEKQLQAAEAEAAGARKRVAALRAQLREKRDALAAVDATLPEAERDGVADEEAFAEADSVAMMLLQEGEGAGEGEDDDEPSAAAHGEQLERVADAVEAAAATHLDKPMRRDSTAHAALKARRAESRGAKLALRAAIHGLRADVHDAASDASLASSNAKDFRALREAEKRVLAGLKKQCATRRRAFAAERASRDAELGAISFVSALVSRNLNGFRHYLAVLAVKRAGRPARELCTGDDPDSACAQGLTEEGEEHEMPAMPTGAVGPATVDFDDGERIHTVHTDDGGLVEQSSDGSEALTYGEESELLPPDPLADARRAAEDAAEREALQAEAARAAAAHAAKIERLKRESEVEAQRAALDGAKKDAERAARAAVDSAEREKLSATTGVKEAKLALTAAAGEEREVCDDGRDVAKQRVDRQQRKLDEASRELDALQNEAARATQLQEKLAAQLEEARAAGSADERMYAAAHREAVRARAARVRQVSAAQAKMAGVRAELEAASTAARDAQLACADAVEATATARSKLSEAREKKAAMAKKLRQLLLESKAKELAGALQAPPLPRAEPLTLRACGLYTTCSDCTADPTCGWLADSRSCVVGDAAGGPLLQATRASLAAHDLTAAAQAPKPPADWHYATCPAGDCTDYDDCEQCLADSRCGFCAGSLSCLPGARGGPTGDVACGDRSKELFDTWVHPDRVAGATICPPRRHVLTEATGEPQQAARRRVLKLRADRVRAAEKLARALHVLEGVTSPTVKVPAEAAVKERRHVLSTLEARLRDALDDLAAAQTGKPRTMADGLRDGLIASIKRAAHREGYLQGVADEVKLREEARRKQEEAARRRAAEEAARRAAALRAARLAAAAAAGPDDSALTEDGMCVALKTTMRLKVPFDTLRGNDAAQARFRTSFADQLSKALKTKAERIKVTGLREGSILVDFLLFPPLDDLSSGAPWDLVDELKDQLKNSGALFDGATLAQADAEFAIVATEVKVRAPKAATGGAQAPPPEQVEDEQEEEEEEAELTTPPKVESVDLDAIAEESGMDLDALKRLTAAADDDDSDDDDDGDDDDDSDDDAASSDDEDGDDADDADVEAGDEGVLTEAGSQPAKAAEEKESPPAEATGGAGAPGADEEAIFTTEKPGLYASDIDLAYGPGGDPEAGAVRASTGGTGGAMEEDAPDVDWTLAITKEEVAELNPCPAPKPLVPDGVGESIALQAHATGATGATMLSGDEELPPARPDGEGEGGEPPSLGPDTDTLEESDSYAPDPRLSVAYAPKLEDVGAPASNGLADLGKTKPEGVEADARVRAAAKAVTKARETASVATTESKLADAKVVGSANAVLAASQAADKAVSALTTVRAELADERTKLLEPQAKLSAAQERAAEKTRAVEAAQTALNAADAGLNAARNAAHNEQRHRGYVPHHVQVQVQLAELDVRNKRDARGAAQKAAGEANGEVAAAQAALDAVQKVVDEVATRERAASTASDDASAALDAAKKAHAAAEETAEAKKTAAADAAKASQDAAAAFNTTVSDVEESKFTLMSVTLGPDGAEAVTVGRAGLLTRADVAAADGDDGDGAGWRLDSGSPGMLLLRPSWAKLRQLRRRLRQERQQLARLGKDASGLKALVELPCRGAGVFEFVRLARRWRSMRELRAWMADSPAKVSATAGAARRGYYPSLPGARCQLDVTAWLSGAWTERNYAGLAVRVVADDGDSWGVWQPDMSLAATAPERHSYKLSSDDLAFYARDEPSLARQLSAYTGRNELYLQLSEAFVAALRDKVPGGVVAGGTLTLPCAGAPFVASRVTEAVPREQLQAGALPRPPASVRSWPRTTVTPPAGNARGRCKVAVGDALAAWAGNATNAGLMLAAAAGKSLDGASLQVDARRPVDLTVVWDVPLTRVALAQADWKAACTASTVLRGGAGGAAADGGVLGMLPPDGRSPVVNLLRLRAGLLSRIDPGALVYSAKLKLRVRSMLRWTLLAVASEWQADALSSYALPQLDRLGRKSQNATGRDAAWVTLDLTEPMKRWVLSGDANFGVALLPTAPALLRVWGPDAPADLRPQLEVKYKMLPRFERSMPLTVANVTAVEVGRKPRDEEKHVTLYAGDYSKLLFRLSDSLLAGINGTRLTSASLQWSCQLSRSNMSYTLFDAAAPWVAGEVDWASAPAGRKVARVVGTAKPGVCSLPLTGLLKRWLAEPASNRGAYLSADGDDADATAAGAAMNVSLPAACDRPQLVLHNPDHDEVLVLDASRADAVLVGAVYRRVNAPALRARLAGQSELVIRPELAPLLSLGVQYNVEKVVMRLKCDVADPGQWSWFSILRPWTADSLGFGAGQAVAVNEAAPWSLTVDRDGWCSFDLTRDVAVARAKGAFYGIKLQAAPEAAASFVGPSTVDAERAPRLDVQILKVNIVTRKTALRGDALRVVESGYSDDASTDRALLLRQVLANRAYVRLNSSSAGAVLNPLLDALDRAGGQRLLLSLPCSIRGWMGAYFVNAPWTARNISYATAPWGDWVGERAPGKKRCAVDITSRAANWAGQLAPNYGLLFTARGYWRDDKPRLGGWLHGGAGARIEARTPLPKRSLPLRPRGRHVRPAVTLVQLGDSGPAAYTARSVVANPATGKEALLRVSSGALAAAVPDGALVKAATLRMPCTIRGEAFLYFVGEKWSLASLARTRTAPRHVWLGHGFTRSPLGDDSFTGPCEFDITSLVQRWVNEPAANYGVKLVAAAGGSVTLRDSSRHVPADLQLQLWSAPQAKRQLSQSELEFVGINQPYADDSKPVVSVTEFRRQVLFTLTAETLEDYSIVRNASLRFACEFTSDKPVYAYPVTEAWDAATLTIPDTKLDMDAAVQLQATAGRCSIDITALMRRWRRQPERNFGICIRAGKGAGVKLSTGLADKPERPVLRVVEQAYY